MPMPPLPLDEMDDAQAGGAMPAEMGEPDDPLALLEQLDPEALAALQEEHERLERERKDRVQALGATLLRLRDRAIAARTDVEERWLEDLRQYHGRYDAATEAALGKDRTKSKVFLNLTRQKTNAAEARLVDMLFPTDDRSWDLLPTPVPTLPDGAVQPPQAPQAPALPMPGAVPGMPPDAAQALMGPMAPQMPAPAPGQAAAQQQAATLVEAKRRAAAMREEIDDQLRESAWHAVARDVIHDGCLLGTGIVKGPIVVGRDRRAWHSQPQPDGSVVQVLEVVQDLRPGLERVDPWNFFADDQAASMADAEWVWERHFLSATQIRDLTRRPGFDAETIREALKEGPTGSQSATVLSDMARRREVEGQQAVTDYGRWELWEYHGPLDAQALADCGCDVDPEDPLDQMQGVVWMLGARVVKAAVHPQSTGELPYGVFNWEASEVSPYGYGVPYQLRHPQRVANAGWRGTMENASLTIGPQIAINREVVEPADGTWDLYGKKIWYIKDRTVPVGSAFQVSDVPSRQAELANIVQSAMRLADEETGLPVIAQGEQGNATKTAMGMSILQNSANVVLRRAVKSWDDAITSPLIRRFYDWNMEHSEREDIKGDFQVDARGSSTLMVKEQQAQSLMQLMGLAQSPVFGPMLKPAALLRKAVQTHQISADEIVLSDEELAARQAQAQGQQQQDPAMLKLQQDYKIHQERLQAEQQALQAKLWDAQQERQARLQERAMEREVAMLKLSADQNLSLEQIKAAMAQTTMVEQNKQDLFRQERDLRLATGQGI